MENETELEIKHDIKDIDMSGYTDEQWFNEIYDYLEMIMTPSDPVPPAKPLTEQGKINQKARVKELIKAEFDKRFSYLLIRNLL
tara:strand:- start:4304 stop:4555 length:252 start_codon:yes stop_codon:yes gene_type:complete